MAHGMQDRPRPGLGEGRRGPRPPEAAHARCYLPGVIFVLFNTETVHPYVQKSSGFLRPRSNSLPLSSWTGSRGTQLESQPAVSKPRAAGPRLPDPQDHRPRWQGCRGCEPGGSRLPQAFPAQMPWRLPPAAPQAHQSHNAHPTGPHLYSPLLFLGT